METVRGFWASLDWSQWLYGLFVAMISGGSMAVQGAFAANIIDSSFQIGSTKSFKLMFLLFGYSAVKDFFLYLKQNPLPRIKTTVTETLAIGDVSKTVTKTTEQDVPKGNQ